MDKGLKDAANKADSFSSDNIQRSKVAKHLDDPFTNRDLFGVVRGRCLQCDCDAYLKATKEYTLSPGNCTGRRHPDNDPTITHCTKCGCPPDKHAVLESENEKEHGNDAFEFGDFDVALLRYTKAIDHHPCDAKLWSNRSAVYLQKGWFAQALHDADRAVQLEPAWAKPRARKALAHLKLHQLAAAARAYRACIKLEPANKEYRRGLEQAERLEKKEQDPK
eukprot:gene27251-33557_t